MLAAAPAAAVVANGINVFVSVPHQEPDDEVRSEPGADRADERMAADSVAGAKAGPTGTAAAPMIGVASRSEQRRVLVRARRAGRRPSSRRRAKPGGRCASSHDENAPPQPTCRAIRTSSSPSAARASGAARRRRGRYRSASGTPPRSPRASPWHSRHKNQQAEDPRRDRADHEQPRALRRRRPGDAAVAAGGRAPSRSAPSRARDPVGRARREMRRLEGQK
jgi:hypothetical protein